MSWSMNTVCRNRSLALSVLGSLLILTGLCRGQEENLRPPSNAVAGAASSMATSGSGTATFYLVGPAVAVKRDVQLGQEISLSAKDLRNAGRYVAVVCSGSCSSAAFFVSAAKPDNLAFLVHPSRAPVGGSEAISGVAFPFDEFGNLVLAPATIQFEWGATKGSALSSHPEQTHDGVAWFRTNSGKAAGPLHITASLGALRTSRVVEEVASDPCHLTIKGQRTKKGIEVETAPVRDCDGNPVPDGTIVTFTAKDGNQTSTVDAPIKQDVARARILATGPVVISAASGVVMGNELKVAGR